MEDRPTRRALSFSAQGADRSASTRRTANAEHDYFNQKCIALKLSMSEREVLGCSGVEAASSLHRWRDRTVQGFIDTEYIATIFR